MSRPGGGFTRGFETLAHDLRISRECLRTVTSLLRWSSCMLAPCNPHPKAEAALGTMEPRKNGSKVHTAVDTLGNLLALTITAANKLEQSQIGEWTGRFEPCTTAMPFPVKSAIMEVSIWQRAIVRKRSVGSLKTAISAPWCKSSFVSCLSGIEVFLSNCTCFSVDLFWPFGQRHLVPLVPNAGEQL